MKGKRRALWAIVICVALLIAAFELYFSGCYHGGEEALRCMASGEGVTVTEEAGCIAFDGPDCEAALVFWPGAKVASEAYAPLMRLIARQGVDAWLIRPPKHFAPLAMNGASRIMADHPRARWFVGGHSLGGVVACAWAGRHAGELSGVVLLASYPAIRLSKELRLLSVRGSRDGVLNLRSYDDSRSKWPADSREYVLEGGNHAGFGDYGPQKGDLSPDMPASEQWTETARLISAFCMED